MFSAFEVLAVTRTGVSSLITGCDSGQSISLRNIKSDASNFTITTDTKIVFKKEAMEVDTLKQAMIIALRDSSKDTYTAGNSGFFGVTFNIMLDNNRS